MEPVVRGSADASPRDEAPTGRIPPTRPFADQRRVGTEQRTREARLPLKFLTWAERGGVGVGRDPHVGGVCGTPGWRRLPQAPTTESAAWWGGDFQSLIIDPC